MSKKTKSTAWAANGSPRPKPRKMSAIDGIVTKNEFKQKENTMINLGELISVNEVTNIKLNDEFASFDGFEIKATTTSSGGMKGLAPTRGFF